MGPARRAGRGTTGVTAAHGLDRPAHGLDRAFRAGDAAGGPAREPASSARPGAACQACGSRPAASTAAQLLIGEGRADRAHGGSGRANERGGTELDPASASR